MTPRSEVEIGWKLPARAYWGGVYNREMKELMLRHAFQYVRSVVFLVGPNNMRSQHAMEKIGGMRLGMTRREPGGTGKRRLRDHARGVRHTFSGGVS